MKHHGWSRKDDFKRGDGFIHSRWGHSIFGSPTVEKNYGVVLDVSLVDPLSCFVDDAIGLLRSGLRRIL